MYYLRLKEDRAGRRWKVREAVSLQAAINCIIFAMASGSVGGKDTETNIHPGRITSWPPGEYGNPNVTRVLADVVRVNPDNSEVRPS